MDYQTYQDIQWLERLGDRGKFLQVILGEVLKQGDCTIYECNLVEGKDLYLELRGEKYGLEVKTCDSMKVTVGDKDLRDIKEAGKDVNPGFAVLRIHPNAEWRITDPKVFEIGNQHTLPVTAMRANPLSELQNIVNTHNDSVLQSVVREMKEAGYGKTDDLGVKELKRKLLQEN
ncbi:MAG: hypothetical protein V5A57_03485 [Candidatus Paceibacterota bacterium]